MRQNRTPVTIRFSDEAADWLRRTSDETDLSVNRIVEALVTSAARRNVLVTIEYVVIENTDDDPA